MRISKKSLNENFAEFEIEQEQSRDKIHRDMDYTHISYHIFFRFF